MQNKQTQQHTPGPWYVAQHETINGGAPTIFGDNGAVMIARTLYTDGNGTEKADARVMAAGPAMLAALQALLAVADQIDTSGFPLELDAALGEAQDAARAAIRAATEARP